MAVLTSKVLSAIPGIEHAFGTREEPFPRVWQERWNQTKPDWKQVHGVRTAEATGPRALCGDADGIHSSTPGQLIAVITADCLPVLLARRDGTRVSAIHAGWRGLYGGIVEKFWAERAASGERASDWVAAIGPAIGPCCYEVSEELAEQFREKFAPLGQELVVPRHRHLALAETQAASLRALGLHAVEVLPHCTRCSLSADGSPLSFSYRREGAGTKQWSVIGRR